MTPEHQLKRNEAFQGLNDKQAHVKKHYLHFRNVQSDMKKRLLESAQAPFVTNFLENVSHDKPNGCWSLQNDDRNESVILRSLTWPGYQFYHKINTKKFGGIYIGDGLKNLEVQFIVQ